MVSRNRSLRVLILLLLVFGLGACQPDPDSARGIAERFLDAHYVSIDLQAAKAYCAGLALRRLEDEIRLTAGHSIDESTRQPQVYYQLLEERRRAKNKASLLYEATIVVEGAGQFQKKILLTLRNRGEGWRVTNYNEFD